MPDQDNHTGPLDETRMARILRRAGRRPQPRDEMAREVRAAVHDVWRLEVERRQADRGWKRREWLALAASVVVVVAAGLSGLWQPPVADAGTVSRTLGRVEYHARGVWKPLLPGQTVESAAIRTGAGGYAALNLTSGINVRLAPGSQIKPVRADLISLESGRVYVDTAGADAGTSISVRTHWGIVHDIGTRFLVGSDKSGWRVQVRDGIVDVKDDDTALRAGPRDSIAISADNRIRKSVVEPTDPSWSWAQKVSPPIRIEGAALMDYLNWYSRETGIEVRFEDERARREAKNTILHGSIDGLQPAESLRVVLSSTELIEIREDGGAITLAREK